MKKIISSLLVVMVLFNFILCNKAWATEIPEINSESYESIEESLDPQKMEDISAGKSSSGEMGWSILGSILPTISGILFKVINLYPQLIQYIMSATTGVEVFTIEKIVFNEIPIFDINYFDVDTQELEEENEILKTLRSNVAKWFYIVRLLAIAMNLVVLIYVGIRMALSTIASDKVKYKEMLISWLGSIIILFLMHYILRLILNVGSLFNDLISNIYQQVKGNGAQNFEITCLNTVNGSLFNSSGWTFTLYSIVLWYIVSLQLKFYILYFKRLLTVGFLIIISPLVTVTYAIDKIGDVKAQAFTVMLTEFSMNVFIQPIHAFIYMFFIFTAGEIAQKSMLVALVFLLFMTKVEKFILQLFNLKNVVSLQPIEDNQNLK